MTRFMVRASERTRTTHYNWGYSHYSYIVICRLSYTSLIMWHYLLWVWTGSWWTLPVWEEHSSSVWPARFCVGRLLRRHWDQLQPHCEQPHSLGPGGPACSASPASQSSPDSLLSPPSRSGTCGTESGQRCTSLLMSWPPTGPHHCQRPGRTLGCPGRAGNRESHCKLLMNVVLFCVCFEFNIIMFHFK